MPGLTLDLKLFLVLVFRVRLRAPAAALRVTPGRRILEPERLHRRQIEALAERRTHRLAGHQLPTHHLAAIDGILLPAVIVPIGAEPADEFTPGAPAPL